MKIFLILAFFQVIALKDFVVDCQSIQDLCLNAHNKLRRVHQNTPDLTWDSTLAAESQQWAQYLLRLGTLKHSSGNYGENLFMASGSWGRPIDCAMASFSWYNEEKDWDYDNAKRIRGVTGHFTQLVWKGSTKVGVGIASGRGGTFIVARYTPAGNYWGQYKANVMKKIPGATTPTEDSLRKLDGTRPTNVPPPPPVTDNPTPPPPPPPTTDVAPPKSSLAALCLNAHNKLRRVHQNTPDLTWDSTLAAESQQWAQYLLGLGSLKHSSGNYGENLFMASGSWGRPIDCAMASFSWYNEEKDWDYDNAKRIRGVTGHFTQLVWKGSTKVGVGIASGRGGTFIVARYTPAGNYWGQYKANVMKKIPGASKPTEDELRNVDGTSPSDPPPPAGTPPPPPPPPPPTQPSDCKDISSKCPWYKHKCQWNNFVRMRCKKTCGIC